MIYQIDEYLTDDIVLESEYNVINSLLDAYDKAYTILESCDDNDILESFDLFQEQEVFVEWKKGPNDKRSDKWTKQMMEDNPGFVPDKQKFKFRQNKKNGKKESIIRSIWKLIPRLYQHAQQIWNRHMQKKRLRYIHDQANKLGVDTSHMSPGELELFYTICNRNMSPEELKKAIKKANQSQAIKHFLIKAGLKIGTGAIVIGGTVYELNKYGVMVTSAIENFKGKIYKKFDEGVLKQIRETGDEVVSKIQQAGEKVANLVQQAMRKAIEFIKKTIASIKKFFNINILGYEKTSDESVVCKFDPTDGTFYVTMDLDVMDEFMNQSSKFINQSAKMISHYFENGELKRSDENKRTGAFVDFERDKHQEKNPIKKKAMPGAEESINHFYSEIQKLFSKAKKKSEYKPLTQFTQKASVISDTIAKVNNGLKELIDKYQKNVDNADDGNMWTPIEKKMLEALRGIMDVQINLQSSIVAVNEYIDNMTKAVNDLSIDES